MNELNGKQLSAVKNFRGKMIVLAGPGSGKTTIITHKVKYLLENCNVDEKNILVITFTKAAAIEMKKRFEKIYGTNKVLFATFHSFFFKIIRSFYDLSTKNILKENERKNILKQIINSEFEIDDDFLQSISNEISLLKNDLHDINFYSSKICATDEFQKIFLAYEKYKQEKCKIDFDDILSLCYKVLTQNIAIKNFYRDRYKFILIDEFQDINRTQYECIKLLTNENLFVVGDDDQSIYKFRGASPKFLLDFPKDFPDAKIIILDKNYRSTEKIISFCGKIIAQNKNRYEKKFSGRGIIGSEPKILQFENITQQAQKISEMIKKNPAKINDTAVIFRTNIQARAFVENFMNLNIAYKLKDEFSNIYENWAVKDILAYMKFSVDNKNISALAQIINHPKRFVSKTIFAKATKKSYNVLENLFNDKSLPMWQRTYIEELIFHLNELVLKKPYDCVRYIRKIIGYDKFIKEFRWLSEILDEFQESAKNFSDIQDFIFYAENFSAKIKNNNGGVTLTTMHSAKGLEFDTVFIISAIEGLIPHEKNYEIEEELRLFYVALTRAKNNLFISVTKNRYELKAEPSRFLDIILKKEN